MGGLEFDENLGASRSRTLYRTRDVLRRRRWSARPSTRAPASGSSTSAAGRASTSRSCSTWSGPTGPSSASTAARQMLAARRRAAARAHANVAFHKAMRPRCPVEDASFDAALCVQVLEYVEDVDGGARRDAPSAAPGGRVVVWDVDWATVSWHSTDPARMERVLSAWDEHLTHPSLPRTLAARPAGGRASRTSASRDTSSPHRARSRGLRAALLPLIEQFVAGRDEVGADEAQAWAAEQRELGARGEFFFACTQFCFTATKRSSRASRRARASR